MRRTNEVEKVLEDKEEKDLREDGLPCGEGNLPGRHADTLSQGMEEPNLPSTLVG